MHSVRINTHTHLELETVEALHAKNEETPHTQTFDKRDKIMHAKMTTKLSSCVQLVMRARVGDREGAGGGGGKGIKLVRAEIGGGGGERGGGGGVYKVLRYKQCCLQTSRSFHESLKCNSL